MDKKSTASTVVDVNLRRAGFEPDPSRNITLGTDTLATTHFRLIEPLFYTFQVINGLGALGLVLDPRATHERMMKNPKEAYALLGFSGTAVEMLHNVLRGQGAALLAISTAAAYTGPKHRESYALIASTCLYSAVANVLTARHHRNNSIVMSAVQDLTPLYGLIGLNAFIGGASLLVFLNWNNL